METIQQKKAMIAFPVADGVWGIQDIMVNVYLVEHENKKDWILVDAGMKTAHGKIMKAAERLFGGRPPLCIVLTHGHFDHTGSLQSLEREWQVPIYAHPLEFPYLTGKSAYPPADPSVGGGALASLSFLYPKKPIDVSEWLLPIDDTMRLEALPGWRFFHTPGHAPGHISLFRESDRLLLAGDAFVTTKQESAISVLLQLHKVSGPPKYFTYDWHQAHSSVELLASLRPSIVATGHGRPMGGPEFERQFHELLDHFYRDAMPSHGRYITNPAITDQSGVVYIPPAPVSKNDHVVMGIAAFTAGLIFFRMIRKMM